jgi:hypothetical protein
MMGILMEKLKELKKETLPVPDVVKKDKEDFKKDLENFISYWEKEAEELKNRDITENDSQIIMLNYQLAEREVSLYRNLNGFTLSDSRKLNLTRSKLWNSLAIARSNYRSKHRTIWERLADNFGIKFHIFGKGN